jgi:hypothetical protein
MDALQKSLREQRMRNLANYLRTKQPELVADIPADELSDVIHNGIARAAKYSINWDSSLALFLAFMLRTAPNFDEHPKIQQLLSDERMEPNARIETMLAHTTDKDWREVMARYDESAW